MMRKGKKIQAAEEEREKMEQRSACVHAAQKSLTSLIKTCLLSGAILQMLTPRGKPLSVTSHTHTEKNKI